MIIVLNGPINSGKTTLAKILWEKIPNMAHVEVDKIREFIDWMDNHPAWEISYETSLKVVREFVKKDLNVIITYHISDEGYKQLAKELKDLDTDIYGFTLMPSIEKVLENRGTRKIDKREKEYIKDSYQRKLNRVTYGETIDNTNQTPQETAEYILSKINTKGNTNKSYSRRDKSLYL